MRYRCAYVLANLVKVSVPCSSWDVACEYATEASDKFGPALHHEAYAQAYELRDGVRYFISREQRYLYGVPDA